MQVGNPDEARCARSWTAAHWLRVPVHHPVAADLQTRRYLGPARAPEVTAVEEE
jgi:hypothetical protein